MEAFNTRNENELSLDMVYEVLYVLYYTVQYMYSESTLCFRPLNKLNTPLYYLMV